MSKEKELKKCPFCGGKAELTVNYMDFWVSCTKCFAASSIKDTIIGAITTWNKRDSETFFEKFLQTPDNQAIYMKEKAKVEFLTLKAESAEALKISKGRMKELIAIETLCKEHVDKETECVFDSVKIVLDKLENKNGNK